MVPFNTLFWEFQDKKTPELCNLFSLVIYFYGCSCKIVNLNPRIKVHMESKLQRSPTKLQQNTSSEKKLGRVPTEQCILQ